MSAGAVVTTIGKGLIAAAMLNRAVGGFIAHGVGTTTPVVGNVALETAADLNSGAAWAVDTQSNPSAPVYRAVYAMACGSTETISEVGLFNAAAFGTTHMLYHEVFAGVAVNSGDTITYTVNITVA